MKNQQSDVLKEILDTAYSGYWDWDIKANTEFLSKGFKAMFGYEEHEMESSPEAWQAIAFPEDLPGMFEAFDEHVGSKGEIPFKSNIRFFHKNGNIVHVLCSGSVVEWGPNDEPLRAVGTHLDLTDTLEKQRQLEKKESDWVNFLFDLMPEMVIIADFETGVIIFANKEVERVLGYTSNEIVGKHHSFIHMDADKSTNSEEFKKDRTEQTALVFLKTKSGNQLPTFLKDRTVNYQNRKVKIGVFSNQNKVHQAELKLKQKERQFREMAEKSYDLITLVDNDYSLTYVSPNIKEIGGYEPSDLVGESFWDFLHPDNKKEVIQLLLDFISDRTKEELFYDSKWKHKDPKKSVWLSTRLVRYRHTNENGEEVIREGLSYSKDVTKEKEAEAEKALLEDMKGEFVSIASHQLRTPLTVMRMNLDICERLAVTNNIFEGREELGQRWIQRYQMINSSVDRMADMTADLMLFGKVKAGKLEPQFAKHNIQTLLTEDLRQNHTDIEKYLHPDVYLCNAEVETDSTLFVHIISNLLENAIKYSTCKNEVPQIRMRQEKEWVILDVIDKGIGIPLKDQAKIFKSFTRGSNVNDFNGTGLGLALVKDFCTLCNIQLTFCSKECEGTTFTAHIPVNLSKIDI